MDIEQEVQEIFREYQDNESITDEDTFLAFTFDIDQEDPEAVNNPNYFVSSVTDHPAKYAVLEFLENEDKIGRVFIEAVLMMLGGRTREEIEKKLIRKESQREKFDKSF